MKLWHNSVWRGPGRHLFHGKCILLNIWFNFFSFFLHIKNKEIKNSFGKIIGVFKGFPYQFQVDLLSPPVFCSLWGLEGHRMLPMKERMSLKYNLHLCTLMHTPQQTDGSSSSSAPGLPEVCLSHNPGSHLKIHQSNWIKAAHKHMEYQSVAPTEYSNRLRTGNVLKLHI